MLSRSFILLKVILLPSWPPWRSTAAVAQLWKATMLRSMATLQHSRGLLQGVPVAGCGMTRETSAWPHERAPVGADSAGACPWDVAYRVRQAFVVSCKRQWALLLGPGLTSCRRGRTYRICERWQLSRHPALKAGTAPAA